MQYSHYFYICVYIQSIFYIGGLCTFCICVCTFCAFAHLHIVCFAYYVLVAWTNISTCSFACVTRANDKDFDLICKNTKAITITVVLKYFYCSTLTINQAETDDKRDQCCLIIHFWC